MMDGWMFVPVISTPLPLTLSLSPGKVCRLRRTTSMPIQLQTSKKAVSLQRVDTITWIPVQDYPETRSTATKVTSELNHLPNYITNIHNMNNTGKNNWQIKCMCSFSSISLSLSLCSLTLLRFGFYCVSNVFYCRSKHSFQSTCDPTADTGSESDPGGSRCRAVSSNVFG